MPVGALALGHGCDLAVVVVKADADQAAEVMFVGNLKCGTALQATALLPDAGPLSGGGLPGQVALPF